MIQHQGISGILYIMPLAIPLIGFMLVASFSPGPNNIMLAASGANFGVRRTIPHMLGVVLGVSVLLVLFGFGLGKVFEAEPLLRDGLRVLAVLFMIYLSWRIATADGETGTEESKSAPLSTWEAGAFQLINPKVWAVMLTVISGFISPDLPYMPQLILLIAIFVIFTILSVFSWAVFGLIIGRLIKGRRARRLFNFFMSGLLLVSMGPIISDIWSSV